jgi:small nuclear ribonucleoprotein (snRNP)-like protein
MERVGERVQIILSNNFSYTGTILEEDSFFIILKDRFGERVSIGKKDIQVIKVVSNGF